MLLCLLLINTLAISAVCEAGESKRVLVLNSYSYDMVWSRGVSEGITDVFETKDNVDLFVEFMDTKRHSSREHYDDLFKQLKRKYEDTKFDLVITSDDNAARFALEKRSDLFPNVPVVFCGVNNTDFPNRDDFYNITGVLEVPGFKETLDVATRLFPATKTVYLINETRTMGSGDRQAINSILDSFSDRIKPVWWEDKSAEQIMSLLQAMPDDSVILFLSFFGDKGNGKVLSVTEGAEFISENSQRPVFSMWEYLLGGGVFGGQLTSGKYQGETAATIGLKILAGTAPEKISVTTTGANRFMFDFIQLERFGISLKQLPAQSIVINKPTSLFDEFRTIVIYTVILLLFMGSLLVVLCTTNRARKVVEQNLRKSEVQLRTLLNGIPDLVWLKDLNGKYLACNSRFEELFGASQSQIVGKTDYDFVDRKIADYFRKRDKIALEAGKPTIKEEEVQYASDGHWEIVETVKIPVIYNDGETLGVLGIARDVSERKKVEEELLRAHKMESLGTLAGGIAHDFNNLLMGIQGRASLLSLTKGLSDNNIEHIEAIEEYVKSASSLTRQLLGTAQGGKYDPKPTDINGLLQQSSQMFGRTRKEIVIVRDFTDPSPVADVDRQQIEQVLLNIYVNASQAMEKGGILTLASSVEKVDKVNYDKGELLQGVYIKIGVTDTGTGMDQETRQKVFDPFFTTKDKHRGTGLGLASAYGIIKNHGGLITVDSVVGEGTTFNIFLPCSQLPVREELPVNESKVEKGAETILLIDDEDIIVEVGSALLTELGYKVIAVSSGEEAVAIFDKEQEKIDLVVLDLVMPNMDGSETFDILRHMKPSQPVILSSGYAIEGLAAEIMQRGCNAFIQKPFNLNDLSKTVRAVLDGNR